MAPGVVVSKCSTSHGTQVVERFSPLATQPSHLQPAPEEREGGASSSGAETTSDRSSSAPRLSAPPRRSTEMSSSVTGHPQQREEDMARLPETPCKPGLIKVFLSSPFGGMEHERSILIERYLPIVERHCLLHNISLQMVDLRWGITTEQAHANQTLDICLREIDGSDIFIGFYGNRYGTSHKMKLSHTAWVHEAFRVAAARYPWVMDWQDRGITEVEFRHGFLNHPTQRRCAFFFREEEYDTAMQKHYEDRDMYSKAAHYYNGDPSDAAKLSRLKADIRSANACPVQDYATPEEGAAHIFEFLEEQVLHLIQASSQQQLQDGPDIHMSFAAARRRLFIGGQARIARLQSALDDIMHKATTRTEQGRNLLAVYGASGSGKSALLANWAKAHATCAPDDSVFLHFAGCDAESSQLESVFRRLYKHLFAIIGDGGSLEAQDESDDINQEEGRDDLASLAHAHDVHTLVNELPRVLNAAASALAGSNRHLLLTFDALNQLHNTAYTWLPGGAVHKLGWLPTTTPPNVAIIVSTLPCDCKHTLTAWNTPHFEVPAMSEKERRAFVVERMRLASKQLTPPQTAAILNAPPAKNALFMVLLTSELVSFGHFESLDDKIRELTQRETIDDLLIAILTRLERTFSEHGSAVADFLSSIAVSRTGMEAEELRSICGLGAAKHSMAWTALYNALGFLLVERGATLSFLHDYVRRAVRDKYLATREARQRAHARCESFFMERFQRERANVNCRCPSTLALIRKHTCQELVHHHLEAAHAKAASETATDLLFIAACFRHGLLSSTLPDLLRILDALAASDSQSTAAHQNGGDGAGQSASEKAPQHGKGAVQQWPPPQHRQQQQEGRQGQGRERTLRPHGSVLDRLGPLYARTNAVMRFVRTHAHVIDTKLMGVLQCALTMPDTSFIHQQVLDLLCASTTTTTAATTAEDTEPTPYMQWVNKPNVDNPCSFTMALMDFEAVTCAVIDSKGERIAVGTENAMVAVFEVRTCGAVVAVLRGHDNTVLNAGEWNQQVVGAIRAAAFNSDDSLLVSASRDGCVLLWDTTTFSLRHRLHEHTRSIVSMAITSPNALFTTGEDAQLIRWDLNEGRRVKCVQAHSGTILDEGGWLEEVEGAVKAMTMIGDGDVILTGSADAQIKGFDMDLNERFMLSSYDIPLLKRVACLAAAPAGRVFACGDDHGVALIAQLNDTDSTISKVSLLSQHESQVNDLSFSDDGRLLLSASQDKTVRLYVVPDCLAAGKPFTPGAFVPNEPCPHIAVGEGHTSWVLRAAFVAPNAFLSTGFEGALRLWRFDVSKREVECASVTEGHSTAVNTLVPNLRLNMVITGSGDRTCKAWDLDHLAVVVSPNQHKFKVADLTISRDGEHALSASDDRTVCLWRTESGECIGTSVHKPAINYQSVTFAGQHDEFVATGISHGDQCYLWPSAKLDKDPVRLQSGPHSGAQVVCAALSTDESTVALGYMTTSFNRKYSCVTLMRVQDGVREALLEGFTGTLTFVEWAADDRAVVSAAEDGVLRVHARTGAVLCQHDVGATTTSGSLVAHSGGRYIVAVAYGDTMAILQLEITSDAAFAEFKPTWTNKFDSRVAMGTPIPQHNVLACTLLAGQLHFLSLDTGAPLLWLQHTTCLLATAFDPVHSRLALTDDRGGLFLFSLASSSGQALQERGATAAGAGEHTGTNSSNTTSGSNSYKLAALFPAHSSDETARQQSDEAQSHDQSGPRVAGAVTLLKESTLDPLYYMQVASACLQCASFSVDGAQLSLASDGHISERKHENVRSCLVVVDVSSRSVTFRIRSPNLHELEGGVAKYLVGLRHTNEPLSSSVQSSSYFDATDAPATSAEDLQETYLDGYGVTRKFPPSNISWTDMGFTIACLKFFCVSLPFRSSGNRGMLLAGKGCAGILIDTVKHKIVRKLEGQTQGTRLLSTSFDGLSAYTCGGHGTIEKWRVGDGQRVWTTGRHAQVITNPASESPDGRVVATPSADGSCMLWCSETGALLAACLTPLLPDQRNPVSPPAPPQHQQQEQQQQQQQGQQEEQQARRPLECIDQVLGCCWLPTGDYLACATKAGRVCLCRVSDALPSPTSGASEPASGRPSVTGEGSREPSRRQRRRRRSKTKAAKLLQLQPLSECHTEQVSALCISPDLTLVTASSDCTCRVWQLTYTQGNKDGGSAAVVAKAGVVYRQHTRDILDVTFDARFNHILSGGWDHCVKVWRRDGVTINSICVYGNCIRNIVPTRLGGFIVGDRHGHVLFFKPHDNDDRDDGLTRQEFAKSRAIAKWCSTRCWQQSKNIHHV